MNVAAPIADSARNLSDAEPLRIHAPRCDRTVADLHRFWPLSQDAARPLLDGRLAALRRRLGGSPYWCERLRAHALSPSDLRSVADLGWFPTVGRGELGARWADLAAVDPDGPEAPGVFAVRSSGSTGEPISVIKDGYDGVHMWAVLRFWAERLGVSLAPHPRVVLLCALPGGLEYEAALPLLRDGTLRRISTVRPRPLERLREAAPHVLFSDPAGLHWLDGQTGWAPPGIVLSSAQHLPRSLRERFGTLCPVVDYYATTETGPIAWRCLVDPDSWHLLTPDVWVESLDGELIVTRLRDSVLPLLRYRTGDSGTVVWGGCSCGAGGAVIRGFGGRRECRLLRPDGVSVDAWTLAWLFKGVALADFQLRQVGERDFEVDVVSDGEQGALGDRVVQALGVLGWDEARVVVRRVDAVARRGSKPEPFLSALQAAGSCA